MIPELLAYLKARAAARCDLTVARLKARAHARRRLWLLGCVAANQGCVVWTTDSNGVARFDTEATARNIGAVASALEALEDAREDRAKRHQ